LFVVWGFLVVCAIGLVVGDIVASETGCAIIFFFVCGSLVVCGIAFLVAEWRSTRRSPTKAS
jgi:undecaprenyl pyrophosphate phosphatase UppP